MKNTRNKKLIACFLVSMGLNVNQANVSASFGQTMSDMRFLLGFGGQKSRERAMLDELAEKIEMLICKLEISREYKETDTFRKEYCCICHEFYSDLLKIKDNRLAWNSRLYGSITSTINGKNILESYPDNWQDFDKAKEWFVKFAGEISGGKLTVFGKNIKEAVNDLLLYSQNNLNNEKRFKDNSIIKNLNSIIKSNDINSNNCDTENSSISWYNDNIKYSIYKYKDKNNKQYFRLIIDGIKSDNYGDLVFKELNFKNIDTEKLKEFLKSKVDIEEVDIEELIAKLKEDIQDIEIRNLDSISGDIDNDYTLFDLENLQSVIISDSVKKIGEYAFSGCENLKSVIIANSVEEIGKYAFNECKNLKLVSLPNRIKKIPTGLFSDCYNLESIVIPASVEEICGDAFANCESLKFVTILNPNIKFGNGVFQGCKNYHGLFSEKTKINKN